MKRNLPLRHLLAVSVALVGLAACTPVSPQLQTATVPYDPAMQGEVEQSLAQSGAQAANALETLDMLQRADSPPPTPSLNESTLPPDLRRLTTISFTGPAVEVTRQLAASIGYGFIETGNKPEVPGLVNVDDQNISVGKALEDIGLQSQRFATIVVDPNMKRIEFRNNTVSGATPLAAYKAPVMHRRFWTHHAAHHVVHHRPICECVKTAK